MLFWNKTKPNKKAIINEELASLDLSSILEGIEEEPIIRSVNTFSAAAPPTVSIYESGCSYPLDIRNQFPLWALFKTVSTEPNLADLTQSYYNWLTCGTNVDISPNFGFFELEKLKQVNELPKELLLLYSQLFIPSLPEDALDNDVSEEELKTLLNGIYNKLYVKKGAEYSFKYLISLFFKVTPNDIYVVYPKRYLMTLNSGYSSEINGGTPLNTMGRLNYSILRDNNLWNEFSYVVNIKGTGQYIQKERFERLIRPMLHPVGLKDYYQEQQNLFENITETIITRKIEIPKIYNYFFYTLLSTESVDRCNGCSYSAPENVPSYVFPSWSTKIPVGISFGLINISDFWEMEPRLSGVYPNDDINCTGC